MHQQIDGALLSQYYFLDHNHMSTVAGQNTSDFSCTGYEVASMVSVVSLVAEQHSKNIRSAMLSLISAFSPFVVALYM